MGLSSLPAPSEGVLCIILVNTAMSISIFKGIIKTILHIIGIIASPPPSSTSDEFHLSPSDDFIQEFRSMTPTLRFESVCSSCKEPEHDCSVCLTQFEPESEINYCLSCGHLFHKVCLEKWLDYWNITCPLCRTPLIPEDDASCFSWAMIEVCTRFFMYSVYICDNFDVPMYLTFFLAFSVLCLLWCRVSGGFCFVYYVFFLCIWSWCCHIWDQGYTFFGYLWFVHNVLLVRYCKIFWKPFFFFGTLYDYNEACDELGYKTLGIRRYILIRVVSLTRFHQHILQNSLPTPLRKGVWLWLYLIFFSSNYYQDR